MTRPDTRYFFSAGVLILVAAVIWWWITYHDVIQYAYLSPREASLCLFGRSDICDLARSLCRGAHPASIAGYWWGNVLGRICRRVGEHDDGRCKAGMIECPMRSFDFETIRLNFKRIHR